MIMVEESDIPFEEIRDELVSLSKTIGGALSYCCVFGSGAYERPVQHDVDVFFLLNREIPERVKSDVIEGYFELHKKAGLSPDPDYPGEYVHVSEFQNALDGKGFDYDDGVNVQRLELGESMWDEFTSHRHHLSAIGGPTTFIYGSPTRLYSHKISALQTLSTVLMLDRRRRDVRVPELVSWLTSGGKLSMGFKNNTPERTYLEEYLHTALMQLVDENVLSYSDGTFHVKDEDRFERFEERVKFFNNRRR